MLFKGPSELNSQASYSMKEASISSEQNVVIHYFLNDFDFDQA